jgi:hypothetical protein
MTEWACARGCFACYPDAEARGYHDTGCCGSTLCEPERWSHQVVTWLTTEEKFNIALWLEVEKATQQEWCEAEATFKAELAAKPKTYVKWVAREPKEPSKTRAEARVKARQR